MARPKNVLLTEDCDKELYVNDQMESEKVGVKDDPQAKLRALQSEELKKVRGVFRNYEQPGGTESVYIKKFKDVPAFNQVMMDGGEYEIPLYVARFLNGYDYAAPEGHRKVNSCSYPVAQMIMTDVGAVSRENKAGEVLSEPLRWHRRVGFEMGLMG